MQTERFPVLRLRLIQATGWFLKIDFALILNNLTMIGSLKFLINRNLLIFT